jgi:serine/threonine protein kinase/Tol biopolymer transport system component
MPATLPRRVRFGAFELDLDTGELSESGSTIPLAEKPLRILITLAEHRGQLVTRDALQERLWPNDTIVDFEHGINTAIKLLRKTLGDSAEAPRYIETIPRRGYRLMVPVERIRTAISESDPSPGLNLQSNSNVLHEDTEGTICRTRPLAPGTKLGTYEIIGPLGAGSMGEVYRARDLALNREVAVKILPSFVSRDPDALSRFEQEARAAAALNHPNILAIHQLGVFQDAPYLVSELLVGESLRQTLQRGPLPVHKAIDYAAQISEGLAATHDKGIVHRDLKPENIFVTKDGRVKILDFGLAKLISLQTDAGGDANSLKHLTTPGVIMGTVGYMSPEQVKGQAADQLSDLFSFGAIVYEMLSGKRGFRGKTSVETMNVILHEEPPDLLAAGSNIPAALGRIVGHCLEKNPAERFQSARDVGFALGIISVSGSPAIAGPTVGASWVWWPRLRILAEVALFGIVIVLILLPTQKFSEGSRSAVLTSISPPPGEGFWANLTQPVAISPDGRFLALIAMRNAHTQLWLRRLDSADAQPIVGSEDASNPFWSPDSRYIAFFTPGKLKKVDISGSAVSDICPAGLYGMGGTWSPRGVIVFATLADALKQVPDRGGVARPIVGADLSKDDLGQLWPAFLPDGKHFLYLGWRAPAFGSHDDGVWIGSLDGEMARRLPLSSTNVQYSSGYLLFSQDGDLLAQKFDASRLQLSGVPFPMARNLQYDTTFHDGKFTVAGTGTLVYGTAGTGVNTELTWLDRDGNTIGVVGQPGEFERQAISPDGKRIAVGVKPIIEREKIWVYDVDRGTRVPLVADESGAAMYSPAWSPDGKQIAYRTTLGKHSTLLIKASDGSGDERSVFQADYITVTDWSPDGRYIAATATKYRGRVNFESSLEVLKAGSADQPILEIENAVEGKFSPDGRWLAYSDLGSGEVYVTPFPGPGPRIAVSSKGGSDSRWRGDGQELFYVADDQTLTSVQVLESQREFRVLASKPLFRLQLPSNAGFYDVTRDGKRFLVTVRTGTEQLAPLTLITNWTALLQNDSEARP